MTTLDWIALGVALYAAFIVTLIGLGARYTNWRTERRRRWH